MPARDQRTNRLLSLLPDNEYQRLRPHLSRSCWITRKASMRRRVRSSSVFSRRRSRFTGDHDGRRRSAEVGTIGNEGLVGLPVCLGDRDAPSAVYVQVPGTALSMDARIFRGELERSPTLQHGDASLCPAFFNQVAQSAACTHLHRLEQRCCRWLLMTRDRMPSGDFLLTQEFLGMMLGVRRTSVTDVMGTCRGPG